MKRKPPPITAEALREAVQAFRASGGRIKVLPKQKDILQNAVGKRWGNSAIRRLAAQRHGDQIDLPADNDKEGRAKTKAAGRLTGKKEENLSWVPA